MNGMGESTEENTQFAEGGSTFPGTNYTFPGVSQSQEFPNYVENYSGENLLGQSGLGTQNEVSSNLSPYSTSIAPSLISGGISTLGNLWLANQQGRSLPKIQLPRLTSEDISYEQSRQIAQREASKGRTMAKYNIGRGSRTRGEYLANSGVVDATISGNVGSVLAQSKQEETLVNANRRMSVNQYNNELANKEILYNNELKNKQIKDREAYIAAALQNVGATTKDITAIRQQDALINSLGEDYGWYMEDNPNAKWYQKKKNMKSKYKGNY
jgi:hypothetical protein